MFRTEVNDLHMHLNGSISLACLKNIAIRNNASADFEELLRVKAEYKANVKSYPEATLIALIWKQFELIHRIIKTLEDIKEATQDVIATSQASYLEIRTCPKTMGSHDWQAYVAVFIEGLRAGNQQNPDKLAKGLLSLDRTIHNKAMAMAIIDRIELEKQQHGLIVGVDLSGNPIAERTLTGKDLREVLSYALTKNIGLALHIGEVDNAIERAEVDNILSVFLDWFEKHNQDANTFKGKVRLGHSIYLTAAQRALIQKMQLPIEICPTGHQKINWWKKNQVHPIVETYSLWHHPVVLGTDDFTVFEGPAKKESQKLLRILDFPEDGNVAEVYSHHSQFRF